MTARLYHEGLREKEARAERAALARESELVFQFLVARVTTRRCRLCMAFPAQFWHHAVGHAFISFEIHTVVKDIFLKFK